LRNAFRFLGRDMAVDLGTANTLVYVRGRGVALNEPSVVAINTKNNAILAVGTEAKALIGEELGFAGAMALLALLGLLLWRGLRIAAVAREPFGALLAAGVVTMLAFQAFVNIGMTIGIMPITGIPLPLVSYGGSSLVATFLAVGLLENVHMRRHL
jgi:FtsW/RodA/SpoVE-like cell cycle protein/MreB/Mbl protein